MIPLWTSWSATPLFTETRLQEKCYNNMVFPMTCFVNRSIWVIILALLSSRSWFFFNCSLVNKKFKRDTWSSFMYHAWFILLISSRRINVISSGCLMIPLEWACLQHICWLFQGSNKNNSKTHCPVVRDLDIETTTFGTLTMSYEWVLNQEVWSYESYPSI